MSATLAKGGPHYHGQDILSALLDNNVLLWFSCQWLKILILIFNTNIINRTQGRSVSNLLVLRNIRSAKKEIKDFEQIFMYFLFHLLK